MIIFSLDPESPNPGPRRSSGGPVAGCGPSNEVGPVARFQQDISYRRNKRRRNAHRVNEDAEKNERKLPTERSVLSSSYSLDTDIASISSLHIIFIFSSTFLIVNKCLSLNIYTVFPYLYLFVYLPALEIATDHRSGPLAKRVGIPLV